jgi:cytochrome c-type biogenesis protein CcmH
MGWRLPLQFILAAIFTVALATAIVDLSGRGHAIFAQAEVPAALPPPQEITPDQVNAVAREIWCPLCSGVRLDACELKACIQMKEVIALKLAEGDDTDSIKAYFVEQYGPQVLGEPPRSGFNWLAWILPVVAALGGGYFFWRFTERMVQPGEEGALNAAHTPLTLNRGNTETAASQQAEKIIEDDEYTQKLEEELAKYG